MIHIEDVESQIVLSQPSTILNDGTVITGTSLTFNAVYIESEVVDSTEIVETIGGIPKLKNFIDKIRFIITLQFSNNGIFNSYTELVSMFRDFYQSREYPYVTLTLDYTPDFISYDKQTFAVIFETAPTTPSYSDNTRHRGVYKETSIRLLEIPYVGVFE